MNKELLERINETFNKALVNSNADTQLQIKILKNNINALFAEYEQNDGDTSISLDSVEDLNNSEKLEDKAVIETLTEDSMKTILIADDSSLIRNYLERLFINDYNVIVAVDGKDAIEKIQENKNNLDIILLDLVMPISDGFFVLENLKKSDIDIPIIIISGDTSKDSIEKAFQYGVVDMIKKPFDSDIIKEKITRYSK